MAFPHQGKSLRSIADPKTITAAGRLRGLVAIMLRNWLCNAIVALVLVLAFGINWIKPQYEQAPDRLTVAEWTERTLHDIKWWDLNKKGD